MPKTVMFIDDDEAFHQIVRRACRKIPEVAQTMAAFDGAEAIHLLEKAVATSSVLPDVVFVDLNMPVLDGFGFLEEFGALRARHPRLCSVRPVAVLTSSDQQKDRERATTLGADRYIVKAVGLVETQRAIAEAIA